MERGLELWMFCGGLLVFEVVRLKEGCVLLYIVLVGRRELGGESVNVRRNCFKGEYFYCSSCLD